MSVRISDSFLPLLGTPLIRRADAVLITIDKRQKIVAMKVEVSHYILQNNIEVSAIELKSNFDMDIIADNNFFVEIKIENNKPVPYHRLREDVYTDDELNPGLFLYEGGETPTNLFRGYDFFAWTMEYQPVVINRICDNEILYNDSRGKFN